MSTPELERLERHLRELLALLDGGAATNAALERAWTTCASDTEALAELDAGGASKAELRARLERLNELNAVAREAANRERERAAEALAHVRATREGLRELAVAPAVGESCDVAG